MRGTIQQRVREADVQFGPEQVQAHALERVRLAQLHQQQVHLAERKLVAGEHEAGVVGV